MADESVTRSGHDQMTLVELVNRVVDRGIVLGGEITISVADVDLLYLDLRLLLCSVDRLQRSNEAGPPLGRLPGDGVEAAP